MRIDQPYGKRFDEEFANAEPRHKYFIACEGKKTEYRYFKGLIEAREELMINPFIEVIPIRHSLGTNSHPLTIIDEAKDVIDSCDTFFSDLDVVCIIVDRDSKSFSLAQYDEADSMCRQYDFKLIITNPCIELWLLLHYSDLSGYCLQELLENKKTGERTKTEILLKDDFLHGSYNKARIKFERDFKPYVRVAIENSKKYAISVDELKTKIGTNIGSLIEEMIDQGPHAE